MEEPPQFFGHTAKWLNDQIEAFSMNLCMTSNGMREGIWRGRDRDRAGKLMPITNKSTHTHTQIGRQIDTHTERACVHTIAGLST